MKRAAFFVEGHTEVAFVRKLVQHVAGARGVNLIIEEQFGGIFTQRYTDVVAGCSHEVLVANCCNDSAVVSYIRERRLGLEQAGYCLIVGLRDLFPLEHQELQALIAGMRHSLPTGQVPIEIVVAVAEVEAWFIEEIGHFRRVDPVLTDDVVSAAMNYDIQKRAVEKTLSNPAASLHCAYSVAGKAWRKTAKQVARTIDCLDLNSVVLDVRLHSDSLDKFVSEVEKFLV